ncbi:MAG: hypothetical protein ACJAUP_002924 [Cellvibrionaceae bacterium]|jgi:hypothetical protein
MKYAQLYMAKVSGAHKCLVFMLALASFSPFAFSQISSPLGIPLGPFDLQSSLLVEYVDDDNLYRSSGDRVSASITTITPAVELLFDNGVSGFSLAYSLEGATFSGEAASDDYTDQRLDIEAGTLLGGLHRIEVTGSYLESHNSQSVDILSDSELDYFEDTQSGLIYTLGASASIFNLQLSVGEFERFYVNNRFDGPTPVNALFDREESFVGAALLWNYSPRLTFGLSYVDTDIQYVEPDPSRDGNEELISFDIEWEPSRFLSFDVSIGLTDRITRDRGTDTSDYWDVTMELQPVSYSTLSFFTLSYVGESQSTIGGFNQREEFGFRWAHEWTERFETEATYTNSVISYVVNTTGSEVDREDQDDMIEVRTAYQFRRWVNIGVFVQDVVRSSVGSTGEYDQQIYGISAVFQL